MSLVRLLTIVLVIIINCFKLNDGRELALQQSFKSTGVQEVISLTVEFLRDSHLSNNVFIRDGDYTEFSVQQEFVSVVIIGTLEVPSKNVSGFSTKLGSKHHVHLNAPLHGASLRKWKKTYSTTLGLTSTAQVLEARWKCDLFIIVRDASVGQKCKWADTENGLRVNLYALAVLERNFEDVTVVTVTEYVFKGPGKGPGTSVLSGYFGRTGGIKIQLGACKVRKRVIKEFRRPKRSLGTGHRHRHSARSGKRALASTILTALQNRVAQLEQKVPRPIRLLTWMTVILLCIVAGALFAFVKVMALAGIDQTWHDCVLQHLVEIVRKEGKHVGKGADYKDDEVGEDQGQEEEPGIVERCKASQSVVRGTIRVVSFILVAFYEGNLYNSITISKTGAVSNAVNQLMVASRNPALLEPSSRYLLNGTLDPGLSSGRKTQQRLDLPSAIQDCLSGSNASHSSGACVGYEFDPRNLPLGNFKYQHKVQKQELWYRLLHSGSGGSMKKTSGHPITSLLQPLAQFCQWVIETGTFHAWNSLEQMVLYRSTNYSAMAQRIVTTDNVEDVWRLDSASFNNSNDSLLGMRDYLGLLFIYLFLNLTALVIFGSEMTFSCVQARLSRHVVVEGFEICIRSFVVAGTKFKGVYRVVIEFGRKCFKRKCACVKVKHFANNFV